MFKNTVYVKLQSRLICVLDSTDSKNLELIMRRYGLSLDLFKDMVRSHKRDIARLVCVGVWNRVDGTIRLERIDHSSIQEFHYEINLDLGTVKAYASGQRTYRLYRFQEVALEVQAA